MPSRNQHLPKSNFQNSNTDTAPKYLDKDSFIPKQEDSIQQAVGKTEEEGKRQTDNDGRAD